MVSRSVRLFRLRRNVGAFKAANFAFKRARGQLIAVMDSDDVSFPDRFEKQVRFLAKNPKVIVIGGQADVIDETGNVIGAKVLPTRHEQIYGDFGFVHPMIHPACMIRRSLLPRKKILYHTDFGVNSDYWTFFELLNYGHFANLKDTVLNYRIHLTNSSLKDIKSCFLNTVKIRWLAVKRFGYRPTLKSIIVLLAQFLVVSLTPKLVLFGLYLLLRGICSPQNLLKFYWGNQQADLTFLKPLSLPANL